MQDLKKFVVSFTNFIKNNPIFAGVISSFLFWLILVIASTIFAENITSFLYIKIISSNSWLVGFIAVLLYIIIAIILTGLFLIFSFRNKILKKEINVLNNTIHDNEVQYRHFDETGLIQVLQNRNNKEIIENLESIRKSIIENDKTKLDMLLTTGFEPISFHPEHEKEEIKSRYMVSGYENRVATFHEHLLKTKTPTRILLINPYSKYAKERGYEICNDYEHYKYLILRTVLY